MREKTAKEFVVRKLTAILKAFIPKDKFLFGVTTLAGSAAFSQLMVFLVAPVLTRLYGPQEFGLLGVYMSVLSMVAVVSSLRFEVAIPLPGSDVQAANLFGAALLTLSGFTLLLGAALWSSGSAFTRFIKVPDLQPYLWLLPIGVAAAGLYNVLTFWAIRYKGIKPIAYTKLMQSIGMLLTQATLGFLNAGAVGLIMGYIVGNSGGSRMLYKFARKQFQGEVKEISIRGMWETARRYRKFPLFSSFSSFLSAAGLNMPMLLMTSIYGPQVGGWFALVQKMIAAPITLIGKAVAQVYLSEAPALLREQPDKLLKLFLMTSTRLLVLSAVPGLLFAITGPWLFSLFFGEIWRTSGSFAQVLALMFVAKFVATPLSHTLIVVEKQDWQLFWDAGRLILMLGAFTLAFMGGYAPSEAVAVYSVTMCFAYMVLFVISLRALKKAVKTGEGRNGV